MVHKEEEVVGKGAVAVHVLQKELGLQAVLEQLVVGYELENEKDEEKHVSKLSACFKTEIKQGEIQKRGKNTIYIYILLPAARFPDKTNFGPKCHLP